MADQTRNYAHIFRDLNVDHNYIEYVPEFDSYLLTPVQTLEYPEVVRRTLKDTFIWHCDKTCCNGYASQHDQWEFDLEYMNFFQTAPRGTCFILEIIPLNTNHPKFHKSMHRMLFPCPKCVLKGKSTIYDVFVVKSNYNPSDDDDNRNNTRKTSKIQGTLIFALTHSAAAK